MHGSTDFDQFLFCDSCYRTHKKDTDKLNYKKKKGRDNLTGEKYPFSYPLHADMLFKVYWRKSETVPN
ncbi:MAG: hypothetical protein D3917_14280 [Candidatus Electrothrix sp. AX5]|nr:hypothetical protein [Candidatus Electrothrix sp. AX5]